MTGSRAARIAVSVLAMLIGCVVALLVVDRAEGEPSAGRSTGPSPTTSSGAVTPVDVDTRATDAPAHAQEAQVGDCYVLGTEDPTWGMAHVALVDCARPHHGQIVRQHMLTETTAISIDRRPVDDPVIPTVDFALEACVMAVWGEEPSDLPVGPALYFPSNLVHDGFADDVMCARESHQLHTGSVTAGR